MLIFKFNIRNILIVKKNFISNGKNNNWCLGTLIIIYVGTLIIGTIMNYDGLLV